jgi:hypothetical protein
MARDRGASLPDQSQAEVSKLPESGHVGGLVQEVM